MAEGTEAPGTVLPAGTVIGPYEIVRFLARGGTGVVYLARHRTMREEVALKLLYPHLSGDTDFAKRFQREAASMAKLRHPNIVQVFNADTLDGAHYIAMAYAANGTLRQLLDRTPNRQLSVKQALGMCQQVALALQHAHGNGVIHRDIKPGNILIGTDWRVMLADFGIAQVVSEARITQNMASLGTPEYMSPEQGRGAKVDERSDVYSLGIVLYEMLAGRPPFSSDNHLATLFQHAKDSPTVITRYRADIPGPVKQLVHKALAKDPRQRFQNAAQMAEALDLALQGRAPARFDSRQVVMGVGALALASLASAALFWALRPPATPAALPESPAAPIVKLVTTSSDEPAAHEGTKTSAAEPALTSVTDQAPVPLPTATPVPPTATPTVVLLTATPVPNILPSETPATTTATPALAANSGGDEVATTTLPPAPTRTAEPTRMPPETQTPAPTRTAAPSRTPLPTRTPRSTVDPAATPLRIAPASRLPGNVGMSLSSVVAERWGRPLLWTQADPGVCAYINSTDDQGGRPLWRFTARFKLTNRLADTVRLPAGSFALRARNGYVMIGCLPGQVDIAPRSEREVTVSTFFEGDRLSPYVFDLRAARVSACFAPVGNPADLSKAVQAFESQPCAK